MTLSLRTRAGILAFMREEHLPLVEILFAGAEDSLFTAEVLMTQHPNTGEPFKDDAVIGMIPGSSNTDCAKDQFVSLVRRMITESAAFGVIFTIESWTVDPSILVGLTPEESQIEQHRYGRLSDHPNRIEVMFIILEHKEVTASWVGKIVRDAHSARIVSWEENLDRSAEGRFTGFFDVN